MALTRVDLSALPELVSALAAAPAGRPGGPVLIDAEILRTLRDLLQADVVLFNDLAPTQHAFWAQSATMPVVSGPGRDAATDEFFSLFWSSAASHPDRTGDRVTPTCLSDFMTIRQWRGSGMYSLLRPVVDFERQLLLPLPGPPGHSRRVRFLRSRGRDFDDTHRAVASLIRPHLVAHLQAGSLTRFSGHDRCGDHAAVAAGL